MARPVSRSPGVGSSPARRRRRQAAARSSTMSHACAAIRHPSGFFTRRNTATCRVTSLSFWIISQTPSATATEPATRTSQTTPSSENEFQDATVAQTPQTFRESARRTRPRRTLHAEQLSLRDETRLEPSPVRIAVRAPVEALELGRNQVTDPGLVVHAAPGRDARTTGLSPGLPSSPTGEKTPIPFRPAAQNPVFRCSASRAASLAASTHSHDRRDCSIGSMTEFRSAQSVLLIVPGRGSGTAREYDAGPRGRRTRDPWVARAAMFAVVGVAAQPHREN